MHGKWTWVHVVVDTAIDFRIHTVVVGDGEDVGSRSVYTAADLRAEELVEAVAQGDVVALEEACILNPVVGDGVIVGLPVALHTLEGTVLEVAERAVVTLVDIHLAGFGVVEDVVVEVGTQTETEVPVLIL